MAMGTFPPPRRVRCRPRRRRRGGAPGRALEGRGYAEFCALPLAEQARAAEMDSVAGRAGSSARILSVHFVASSFQFYLRLPVATSPSVVGGLDMLERALGGPGGVGGGQKPPVYLQGGEVMRLGIEGLGEQQQKVVLA